MISSATISWSWIEKNNSTFKKTINKNNFPKLFDYLKNNFSDNTNIQIKDTYIYVKEGSKEFIYLYNISTIKDYIRHMHTIPYVQEDLFNKLKNGAVKKDWWIDSAELTIYNPFSKKVEQYHLEQKAYETNRLKYIENWIRDRIKRTVRNSAVQNELSSKVFSMYKQIEDIEETFLELKNSIDSDLWFDFKDDKENQNIFHMMDDIWKVILELASYTNFPWAKEKYMKIVKDIEKIKQDFLDIIFVLTWEEIDREVIKNRLISDIDKIFIDVNKIKKLIYPKYYLKNQN